MGFLLAVLSFVVAEEVVQLEPVMAGHNCSQYNDASKGANYCWASPFCYWLNGECIDDPCLKVFVDGDTCNPKNIGSESIPCVVQDLSATVLNKDCANQGSGRICTRSDYNTFSPYSTEYDYCWYAKLRDGSCPDSVCTENGGDWKGQCRRQWNSPGDCSYLTTKEQCGLTPKCFWHKPLIGSGECITDPCWWGSERQSCGGAFNDPDWINPSVRTWQVKPGGGTLEPSDCKTTYTAKKVGGGTTTYCLYKDNDAANVCYFLGTNDTTSSTDNGVTYPTSIAGTTKCTQTIPGCDDHDSGECTTKWNPKGAFAGAYCGDKTHGGASNVRIPSIFGFLLISLLLSLLK